MYRTVFPSPLGQLTLYSDGTAITAITMPLWRRQPPEKCTECDDLPGFFQTKAWLENYFTGIPSRELPPVDITGTPFQQQVWRILQEIPWGSTLTYGDIARKLSETTGRPTSPRAVGTAVGRNPVAILIPCHRVLGTNNRLTGFGGGLEAKQFLLDLEGIPYRR